MQPIVRTAGAVLLLTLCLALRAGPAAAQCTITGPATMCGGSAELCGPNGPYFYEWTDAAGNPLGDQRCLTVTAPGEYRLSTFDFINGLPAGPCVHVIAAGSSGGACTVTGAGSACQGAVTQLCGPEGVAEYLWSGPGGFTAATRCVEVGDAGSYQLMVRNDPAGCWSAPCEKAVTFEPCTPPVDEPNCPVPAWLWLRQWGGHRYDRHRLFDAQPLARIGKCVDEHAAAFAWKEGGEGFCRTLNARHSLRDRARRQLASVLANVCVRELGLEPKRGGPRGLGGGTALRLDGFSGTVTEWIAQADRRLGELDRRRSSLRDVKQGYRSIIRTGWQINHGLGMGRVCVPATSPMLETAMSVGDVAAETAIDDETLEMELQDPEEGLSFESVLPNPTPGPARIAYVVSATATGEVTLGVYDLAGRLVRLLERGTRAPGRYETSWDGRDASGQPVRNGAYFVVGRLGGARAEGRLILMR